MDDREFVFVTVGTDHHPFDRLIGWIERWSATYDGRVIVQHGFGPAPRGVEATEFVPAHEMAGYFRRAIAVVSHGGPGTVMAARSEGCLPIVVPRLSALDEMVDDHQCAFGGLLQEEGLAHVVFDEADFVARLDAAVADPSSVHFDVADLPEPPGVARTGALIDQLVSRHRAERATPRRRGRVARRWLESMGRTGTR